MRLHKISEANITPVRAQDGLVAFVSFVIDDSFHVDNVALRITPSGGIRLTYPDCILRNGLRKNTFYPITKEVGDYITQQIALEYERFLEKVTKGKRHETYLANAAA